MRPVHVTALLVFLLGLPLMAACSQTSATATPEQGAPTMKEQAAPDPGQDAATQHDGLSLSLHLPAPITDQPKPEQVPVRLTLRNHSAQPVTLKFRSGQMFEVELFRPDGRGLWRWSDGMMFTMALQDITLASGEEEAFGASVPLTDEAGNLLPDGVYRLRFRVLGGVNELLTGPAALQASGVIIIGSGASGSALM